MGTVMIRVDFDITVDETASQAAPLLDEYERAMMLDHTKAQINKHVQQQLTNLYCDEHGEPPKVRITGTYSLETEQLDISYNVDTCCKRFLLRAVTELNRV